MSWPYAGFDADLLLLILQLHILFFYLQVIAFDLHSDHMFRFVGGPLTSVMLVIGSRDYASASCGRFRDLQ